MSYQAVEKPSALLLSTLVLAGFAFGIQNMTRTIAPRNGSIVMPAAEAPVVFVQSPDLDVMMFVHQNSGS